MQRSIVAPLFLCVLHNDQHCNSKENFVIICCRLEDEAVLTSSEELMSDGIGSQVGWFRLSKLQVKTKRSKQSGSLFVRTFEVILDNLAS